MTLKCPACSAVIQADDAYAGLEGECPTCGADIHIPRLAPAPIQPPPSIPPPTSPPKTPKPTDSLLHAGWICFGIGAAIMPFLLIVPIWGPLFGAACLLAIIAMVKGRVGAGLSLLLCTLIAPFIIAGLVLLMGLGAAAAIATSLPSLHPPQTKSVTNPTTTTIPTETLPIDTLFTEMNIYGQKYKEAQTSVRKEEIIKQAQARVTELYRNRALIFRAVIRDVQAPKPGTTRLEYRMVTPNAQNAHSIVSISTTGHVDLKLSRENALKLVPGQTIQITASVVFSRPSIFSTSSATPINISLDFNQIGQLKLQTYRCSIVPANP